MTKYSTPSSENFVYILMPNIEHIPCSLSYGNSLCSLLLSFSASDVVEQVMSTHSTFRFFIFPYFLFHHPSLHSLARPRERRTRVAPLSLSQAANRQPIDVLITLLTRCRLTIMLWLGCSLSAMNRHGTKRQSMHTSSRTCFFVTIYYLVWQ